MTQMELSLLGSSFDFYQQLQGFYALCRIKYFLEVVRFVQVAAGNERGVEI